ncbi:Trifunctional nucleotide phosphoesterase protein YfkN Includes: RecName: Full=2',3'-cyclic-nucleotide 2'-phosphodiesterase/3'-nucleotidase [Rhizoctonia solani AG-1 IB]|uniref:Ypch01255 protein n=1 Tax=Thanatephorus cucumeris (strain AG1-IB / isolate 7/3/14) TaxID=1108050 RepID=M5CAZ5_THACB|nr:Trifunctional nucleotide phosphoesterase protein YfkN Includes: RecName: Full=2',3'-cyclic-nucleotide 2'-phosphodiesterase/3'-nucleotidase [Rhizoctonia solani AG-1 IB]
MSRILKRMLKKEVEPNMKTVIARLPDGTPLGALANSDEASRKGETALGNWIADSMIRWYAKHATRSMRPLNRPIFIMTGGSIRAGSEEVDPDSVTKGDIIRLLPFGSPLCTLRMSGKDLWDTFECALEESGRDPNDPTKINSAGRFPVVSGVWVEWKSTKPAGKRIVSMRLSKEKNNDNEVFRDENHFYDIITHTYLYYGGDHLSPFKRYSKSEDSEKHGYVTETPIYQALLQVIDDLLVDETKEIFNNPPTPDTRVSTVLPSGYPFSNMPQEILPILPLLFPFAPLLRIMADGLSEIAKDDRPNMVTQRLIDEAVTITKTHRLPVLDIPTGPDGRMEDTSMKDGSK